MPNSTYDPNEAFVQMVEAGFPMEDAMHVAQEATSDDEARRLIEERCPLTI